jgi:4-carboxymuconolactone decarboxylase
MSSTVRTASIGVLMVLALSLLEGRDIASSQAGGASAAASTAQMSAGALRNGVYAESGNRLPLVKRDDLDDLGKTLYDQVDADVKSGRALAGFQGPLGLALYSPRVAASDQRKNNYLRFESPIGRRFYELAILVTARELDQQFEWTAHEPAAVRAGVEPAVIDVVKNRLALTGLQPRDAAVIQLGREALGHRVVTSPTYAEALRLFGPHDLFDVVSVMAYYSATAVLLNAFDQQLAPGQTPLLSTR